MQSQEHQKQNENQHQHPEKRIFVPAVSRFFLFFLQIAFQKSCQIVTKEGYEADDILGTLGRKCEAEGMEVTIVSGDRDLLQLATDHILIRIPKTVKRVTTIENYHTAEVLEKYSLLPKQIIDLKALMGDTADNIPGLPGVGEKTATKILLQYETLENAHAHFEEIKPNKAKEAMRDHYDLAELSKKLATIDTDAPVELDREKAALSNFYTPKAYEMFKRLEFKNLLGRFEETNAEPEDAVFLRTVTDFSEAEELFGTIAKEEKAGAALLTEETPKDGPMADRSRSLVGMAVAYGSGEPDVVYFPAEGFLTGDYLKEKLTELQKQIPVFCVMDGKEFLKDMPDADEAHLFDAGIAAYLLNPLKSQYSYDDIVKEYVHRYVPAVEEIFGGSKIPAAGKMTPEQQESYAGHQAYAVFAAQENMEKLLKEQGMWDLYRNVEIPLVFTLRQMEADGIAAEKEALSVYGAELAERIGELEAQIYEEAGEEFNINSPKQLGVILFEKLQLPGGKKTKTGYSTAADVLEKLAPDHKLVAVYDTEVDRLRISSLQRCYLFKRHMEHFRCRHAVDILRLAVRLDQVFIARHMGQHAELNLGIVGIQKDTARLWHEGFPDQTAKLHPRGETAERGAVKDQTSSSGTR